MSWIVQRRVLAVLLLGTMTAWAADAPKPSEPVSAEEVSAQANELIAALQHQRDEAMAKEGALAAQLAKAKKELAAAKAAQVQAKSADDPRVQPGEQDDAK
jgi:hypothetical protein